MMGCRSRSSKSGWTTIQLTGATQVQVARANVAQDEDGPRRATLLFDLAEGEYHTNVVLAVLAVAVGRAHRGEEAALPRLLSAFGVTVLATDARRTAAPDGVAELHPPTALDDLRGMARVARQALRPSDRT